MSDIVTNNQLQTEINTWNVADEYKSLDLDQLKKTQIQQQHPFAIAVINLNGGLNIGTIIRSAVIFGANKIFIIGKRKYDKRSTVGAHNYIGLSFIDKDINDSEQLRQVYDIITDSYTAVFVEQGGPDINSVNFSQFYDPICLIFGEESVGIPPEMMQLSSPQKPSMVVSIAQYGVLRSLNVASAAAIAMHKVATDLSIPRGNK
jgi:tRNA G18 (ribose-2'-O)-methylase SpoU